MAVAVQFQSLHTAIPTVFAVVLKRRVVLICSFFPDDFPGLVSLCTELDIH